MWELLQYTQIPDRDDFEDFNYYKPGIEYKLTETETKLAELEKDDIIEIVDSINPSNRTVLCAVCKIICYSSFGSVQLSR